MKQKITIEELNRIYNEDCLAGMKRIPNRSIDLIVTDPPYRIQQHGSAGTMGGFVTTKSAMKGTVFAHNNTDITDYIDEFYRVLKEDSHCYIMTNNYNICHFLDVVSNSKFHFVKNLIWDKKTKICGRYYMSQYEYVIFLRKGKDRQINDCSCPDILSIPIKKTKVCGRNIHDSEKPVALMKTFISNSTVEGETVLDPFMGSGTTAIAAMETNRNFIGFEIDDTYYDIAEKRIKECA